MSANSCRQTKFMSRRWSISCETENPNILTYLRKRCNSLWSLGLIVASNKGTKMFSNIFPKLGRIFFDLNMSLKGKNIHSCDHSLISLYFSSLSYFLLFVHILQLQFYQDSEIQSLCQGRDHLCAVSCTARHLASSRFCWSSQVLQNYRQCAGVDAVSRTATLSLTAIQVLIGEIRNYLSWKILFSKVMTSPNESRMFCFSEPLRKEG